MWIRSLVCRVFLGGLSTTVFAADPLPSTGSAGSEFGVIFNLVQGQLQRHPDTYAIQGFLPNKGEIAPPDRGLHLAETELAIKTVFSPLLWSSVRVSLSPEGSRTSADIEEAYVETLGFWGGGKLRMGRFLSGMGYANTQHPHNWDFVDAPLAYKGFWGSALAQDGIQFKWVAPTDLFMEWGFEAGRGNAFPGTVNTRSTPGNTALFAHVGDDVGTAHAWQAGISHVRTSSRKRTYLDEDQVTHAFEGSSHTWGADFVWKWAPEGNASSRAFKFQSEIFQRTENGDLTYNTDEPVTDTFQTRQTGGYAQAVYQFMPKWRTGWRYDWLDSGQVDLGPRLSLSDLPYLAAYQPRRHSLMLDYSPSELSRWRLQLARDEARGPGQGDNQAFLQYLLSFGAHGAHKF